MNRLTLQVVVGSVVLSLVLSFALGAAGVDTGDSARQSQRIEELQNISSGVLHHFAAMTVVAGWAFLGLGVLLVLGAAWLAARWALRRIDTVYPDKSGLYPVLRTGLRGGVTLFHDPNRAVASGTSYSREGLPAFLYPETVSESQRQVTTQAQVAQVMAAASSSSSRSGGGDLRRNVAAAQMLSTPMPEVVVSSLSPSHVERLLLENGGVKDVEDEQR